MGIFIKKFLINDSHTSLNRICKMSAIINYLQEATAEHILYENSKEMIKLYNSIGMFLISVFVKINRPLYYGEEVMVETYQHPLTSSKINRAFKLYTKEQLVGEAISVFLLVNIQTRKLVNPTIYTDILDKMTYHGEAFSIHNKKIPRKKVLDATLYQVQYSDTDKNGHMNNVRYAEIISNMIKMNEQQDKYICEMQIDFVSECYVGCEIKISTENKDNLFYVQGVDVKNKLKFKGEVHLDKTINR